MKIRYILSTLVLFFITTLTFAQATVSLANTNFDTCGNQLPQTVLNLGDFTISENLASDFAIGTNTFYIEAPSNFDIIATIATSTGTDITGVTVLQNPSDASQLEITVTVATETSIDELTISNVRIQNNTNALVTDATLKYILNGNTNQINGLADNDILETINFNTLIAGATVTQSVCDLNDLQNISVTGSNITQNRTYEWFIEDTNGWLAIANSNTENLVVDPLTFPSGVSNYRRSTTFTTNGETCTLYSTAANIIVNDVYAGSITEGNSQTICMGETPEQLSSASDIATSPGGTSSYQWYKNDASSWELITGADDSFYQPAALTATTSYKRRFTNTLNGFTCYKETTPITIVVSSVINGGTTTDQNICDLNDLQLLTVNNGDINKDYQWQKLNLGNWEDISGATSSNYDVSSSLSPGVHEYRRITSTAGETCQGISTTATITYIDFSLGNIAAPQTICNGEDPNILASDSETTGEGTITYQWEAFDGTNWNTIAGANTASYQPTALQQTTDFRRFDSITLNGYSCSDYTNEVTITVLDEITGGTASADQTLCEGELPTTISITGGTASNQNISYQWQYSTTSTFINILGETDASLSFSTAPSETTTYRRQTVVTNNSEICIEYSTEATIFINSINTGVIGDDQSICSGETASTLINASNTTATGSLTYIWEASTDAGTSWSAIAGATGATYSPGTLTTSTLFRRQNSSTLNGQNCTSYSNIVTITVGDELNGGTGSIDQTVCEDELPEEITISNGTTAGAGITFQWFSSIDDVQYNAIAGETSESLLFSTPISQSTYYKRKVSLASNSATCETYSTTTLVTIINLTPGSITESTTVCENESVPTITSLGNAVSNGTISYTWQESEDGDIWVDIANTNQPTYVPTVSNELERYFRRKAIATIAGVSCEKESTAVLISVNRFDDVSSHLITFASGDTGDSVVCNGAEPQPFSTNFELFASGVITYQWQMSSDNITYTNISGGTNRTYQAPIVTTDTFYRRITTTTLNGVACSVTSNVLELINGGDATGGEIGTTNANGTNGTEEEVVCFGGDPSLIEELVAPTGQLLTFQWVANDTPISGANSNTYDPPSGITETTTYYYIVYSTNTAGATCEVYSNGVTVLVPAADEIGPDITICSNSSVSELGDVSLIEGIDYLSFQWYESNDGSTFSAITGAINATYTPPGTFTSNKYYRRGYIATVDGIVCGPEKLSNTIQITVNDVTGGSISGNQQICYGENPNIMAENTAGTALGQLSYQWFSSEDNTNWSIIDDAIDSTYDPPAGEFDTTIFKRTTYSSLNGVVCSADSNILNLDVAEEIIPGTLAEDQTVCIGETPSTLNVTGGSTYSDQVYTWFSSNDGAVWTDLGVTTASYSPGIPTETLYYKRTTSRTSLAALTCVVETNIIAVYLNSVVSGRIIDNQSVCEGSQPDPLVEEISATAAGVLTYQWLSSQDNQIYSEISGATQQNYTPPSTLAVSTYFKRRAISTLNGVDCYADTSPRLITVIKYPIIDNATIYQMDITDVSCFEGTDGSITIPDERITGGNSAQKQINTITFTGTPELDVVYSIIINSIVYEHQVTLNALNQTQTNDEIAEALTQVITNATGANLSEVLAVNSTNEIELTAKVAGIPFTVYASTGSATSAIATNVLSQANGVANTYEWIKIGDPAFSATSLSIENLSAGIYQLTVYNEFCGVTSDPFPIEEPDELILTIGDTCNSALTASITGGTAPYTYTLTGPDGIPVVETTNNTNITYTDLVSGELYTLSVLDDKCAIAASDSVTLPSGLEFDIASVVVENTSCFNINDGSINLNIGSTTVTGGFPPYSFNWSGPDGANFSTSNINNLAPGVYVLDVQDQLGCSTSFTTNIASKAELKITSVQVINEQLQCANDNDAEISIQISSDPTSQILINWYKNGTSFASNVTALSDLGVGSYEVVVTDTNSDINSPCEASYLVEVNAPELFVATEVESEGSCFDAATGRAFTFKVAGGTLPYSYTLNNNAPVSFTSLETTIDGLSEESHTIIVTDANQCEVTTFSLARFETISYSGDTSFTIPACENTTSITINKNLVSGGSPYFDINNSPFYLYDWKGPDGFSAQDVTTIEALPGDYRVTISDSKGCTSETLQFTVALTYPELEIEEQITLVGCGETSDGAIAIEISGGKRPYTIIWEKEIAGTEENPNASFSPIQENVTQLSNLSEGRYRLTVTSDILDCSNDNASYYYQNTIDVTTEESLRLTDGPHLDDALCAGTPGSISISVFNAQGGDLSFYYDDALVPSTKTGSDTYEVQIANPIANTVLNVINDKGCGFTEPISVGVIAPSFSFTSDEFVETGLYLTKEDIRFSNLSELGYDRATWNFGDGSPEQSVDYETDGTNITHVYDYPGIFEVSLSVFNSNGCSETLEQTIQIGSGYDVIFPSAFSANADGINDYFEAEFTGIASFTFEIYDMWGGLVYSAAYDYDNLPANWGWNGTYATGKLYSNKTFKYLFVGLTKDNQQITRTGEATILR